MKEYAGKNNFFQNNTEKWKISESKYLDIMPNNLTSGTVFNHLFYIFYKFNSGAFQCQPVRNSSFLLYTLNYFWYSIEV